MDGAQKRCAGCIVTLRFLGGWRAYWQAAQMAWTGDVGRNAVDLRLHVCRGVGQPGRFNEFKLSRTAVKSILRLFDVGPRSSEPAKQTERNQNDNGDTRVHVPLLRENQVGGIHPLEVKSDKACL
jgi:hypothetical protein